MALDASRVIHGMYAKIFIDGVWQTNVEEIRAEVEIQKHKLNLLGDDWVRHKAGRKKGTGSMRGFKVTSEMIRRNFKRFELIVTLEDPEAYGYERIRLMNVMLDKVQLVNVQADDVLREEVEFTFEGYELLDPIEAN